MTGINEYVLDKTIRGEGFVIRVHRPLIDDEERKRRMAQIKREAERLLKK